MVLTKADLQEWNNNPVTRALFKQVREQIDEAREESSLMPTADETAQKTAFKEGVVFGANALLEAYDDALEEAE